MGENKDSCPITVYIDAGRQGTPQDIVVHKSFPNLCGQYFQVYDAIYQGPSPDYLWMERERRDKDLYKIKSQPRVCLKIWEWEHENCLEER